MIWVKTRRFQAPRRVNPEEMKKRRKDNYRLYAANNNHTMPRLPNYAANSADRFVHLRCMRLQALRTNIFTRLHESYYINDILQGQSTMRNCTGTVQNARYGVLSTYLQSTTLRIFQSQSIIKYTRSLQDKNLICGHCLWSIQRYVATILTALLLPPLHQQAGPATSVWLLYCYLLLIKRRNLRFMTTTPTTMILATSTYMTFIIQCAFRPLASFLVM